VGFLHLFFFTLVTRVRTGYTRPMSGYSANSTSVHLTLERFPSDLAVVVLSVAALGVAAVICWRNVVDISQRDLASPLVQHSLLSPIDLAPEPSASERLSAALGQIGF